jgi:hypothetical protein
MQCPKAPSAKKGAQSRLDLPRGDAGTNDTPSDNGASPIGLQSRGTSDDVPGFSALTICAGVPLAENRGRCYALDLFANQMPPRQLLKHDTQRYQYFKPMPCTV